MEAERTFLGSVSEPDPLMLDKTQNLPKEKRGNAGDVKRCTNFSHQTNINSFLLGPKQPSEIISGVRLEPGLGKFSLP